jgi:predicted amidohydrolase YtcJ
VASDLIFKNGRIHTVDAQDSVVAAVAIKGGRFVAAGCEAEVMAQAGRATKVIDLGGRTAIPGIIDSHIHIVSTGTLLEGVMMFDARNMEDLRELVARRVAEAKPGDWILGGGWIDSQFAEYRPPNRWDLDAVSPENPVMLTRLFGGVVVNSKALAMSGIDRNTPDPERGTIERHPQTGEPTGYLRNGAHAIVVRAMAARPAEDPLARACRLIDNGMRELVRWGITSTVEPGAAPLTIRAVQRLREAGRLPLRMNLMPVWHGLYSGMDAVEMPYRATAVGARTGFGDECLRLGALKMAIDGGLGSKTAWCSKPWLDGTRSEIPLRLDIDRLGEYFTTAVTHDWSIGIHCCGDVAQDVASETFARVLAATGNRPHRHNIIHAYLPSQRSLDILAEHGIGVSVQPGFMWVEGDIYFDVVEQERLERFKPLRTYLRHGIKVACNSDMASAHYNPFLGMYAAVARRTSQGRSMGETERVSRREMLRLFTANGAWLSGEEDLKGTIEPGKLADLAVLSGDIMTVPDEAIRDLKVEMTIVGGKVAHSSLA